VSLSDVLKDDLTDVFLSTSEFGVTVTYRTAATGASKSIKAQYGVNVGAVDPFDDAFFLIHSDATLGVASPQPGDQLTTPDSVVWTVVKVRGDGLVSWELRCRAPQEVA
jgi:hypothetical protein